MAAVDVASYSDDVKIIKEEGAEGGELFDFLNKMITIPEKKACRMMYEILKVVSHMHAHNLVHRDLKPENILLTSDQHLLVSDFGFAVQLKENERLRDLCGTPDYLAPEVLKCSIEDDHPGYGLEVDLLAGFSPFWHRKQNVMLWNIIDGKYTLEGPEWNNISENSKDLISKLLVVNPRARITANVAIFHPWFELLRTQSNDPHYEKLVQSKC
ncbi:hypothetical protein MXB_2646 [Myxobolus squamalis]|nr:hypothetical protein MXB_2646 [Myxobolus squamalis]